MKRKWDTAWAKLTRELQELYLTLLWRDGHSEKAIADFFRTGKGSIVRRRHTLALPSTDRGKIKGAISYDHFRDLLDIHAMEQAEAGTNVVCIAPLENRPEPPKEHEEMAEEDIEPPPAEARPVPPQQRPLQAETDVAGDIQRTSSRIVRPKVAASEAVQCVHRDKENLRCAYEWTDPVTKLCDMHK